MGPSEKEKELFTGAYRQLERKDWYLSAIVDLLVDLQFPQQLADRAKGLAGVVYEAIQQEEPLSPCSVRTIGRAARRYVLDGRPLANDYSRMALARTDIALLTGHLAAMWFPEEEQTTALGLVSSIYWTLQNQAQADYLTELTREMH